MLNIWKRSSHPKAETYLFPDTEELESKELETAEAEEPLPPMEEPEQSRAEEPPASTASLQYAQVQADQMLLEARRQAEKILEDARQEVDFVSYLPAEDLSGYDEFYSRMTYQEGSEHTLYLRWSWGYDDVTIRVELPGQKPTMCACTPSPGRTVCRKNTTTPSIPQCSGQWT